MDLSLVIQKVEPPGRIHFHSRRVKRAGRVASCSATSLVSVSKSQRWQIVLAVIAGLLAGTVAQHKGSSVAPHQTPPGSRENSSASMVFQHSTEARHVVEKDLQNRSTEGQPDLLGLGRNLYTRNSVADLIGTTVPFHIASTSSDPSTASGPLSSPVVQMEKNSSGGLDLAASSSGGSLSQTHASLGASSKGLKESSGTTSVVQPVEKRKPALTYTTGLFRTLSPTSPFLPSNGSASDVKPVLQTALSHPSRDTSRISASSIVQPTAATFLTSTMLPAPEGSTHGEQHIAGTSQPVTQISRRTHLNQKSTSHRGDLLPPAAMGFLGYQTVAEASASPKIIGMNLSHPTLPMGTIPSEATPIATDVFHSSHGATTQRLLESILRVSTGMQPGSLPALSPAASPKDTALLQEAVSNGQGLGSTESVIRGPLVSTAVPTTPSQSSSWPLSSSSRGVTHATLPAFVTQVDSSETKGLATHNLSWPRSVPASLGSPKSEDVTALSTTADGIQVSAKDNAEVPLSATSVTEESGARYEVSVGRVLSGHDLATVSALTGQQTLSYSSITQASPGSEATSRFPLRNASLLVPPAPGPNSTSSTGEAESTASKLESGTTTRSPRSSPSGLSSVHLPLSTVPLELDTVPAAVSPTEGVPFAPHSATPGEGSTSLGSTSAVNLAAFLDTTEVQERTPATSPFPGEGAEQEWKEEISSTAELSTGVPGHVSILDGQSEPTVLDVSSTALPTHALSHPTITVTHSRGEETRYSVHFLHSWASLSTSEAVPSADVTSSGSYEEQMRPELQDGTRQFTTAVKISTSPSELTLSALGAASSTDSSSNLTSGMLELQPTQKHVSFPRKTTRSTSAPPLSSTFPTTDSSSSLPSAMLELQPTQKHFSSPRKTTRSMSAPPLSSTFPTTDSSSSLTSVMLELQPTQKHFSSPRKTTRSTSAPPLSSTFPTTDSSSSLPSAMLELQPTQKHFSFPRKTTRSTSAPPLSSTFPTTDSSSSLTSVMLELQPTQKHFSSPRKITRSMSAPPLSSTFPTTDSSSSLPSAMLGFQPTQKHVSFPRKTTRSTSALPPSSLFLATSRMNTSMESSEPNTLTESSSTEGGSNASLPTSTTESKATLSYPFLDITGVGQPFRTTAAETRHVEMVTGRPSTGKELFSWTPSEWRLDISTLPHVGANRTEATDTSRAADTSTVFLVHSTSHGGSSKGPADLSLGETKSTVMPHPTATQAVSLTSNITALLDSSRVLPTASVLTTRVTCSGIHCLSITLPVSSAATQLPITSQTLPQKVSVTTLGSTVGKKGTTAGPSTKVDAPKMIQTTALTSTKPVTTTRGGPTSKQLVSTRRASTVGQTAERDNFTVSKQTLDVSILSLQFQLARIEYTESLASKSSVRYKKLEREVTLTLNKMLSSYESFLQANVLRFLSGSVLVQGEAMFQEGHVPTPSDMIRTIVTAIEKREMDTFFDWRMDLKSVRSNEFSLKNLEPEVLSISFTVLGRGSIATFGGLTEWGPLERLRNEVVLSLSVRYRVQNFSLAQVRNVQGDLDINGEMYVNTEAHVDIGWALEALKGLANYSVDLGSICINGSKLSLQIFQFSFLVTNRIFSEKLLDRSSMAHQRLSWDLSKALTHMLGQYQNLLQVTIREMRSGSLICQGDVIFQPPAPTNKDVVHTLALSVGPKNYLGASNIQVDPFSFMVAGAKLEPPYTNPSIPSYGIVLIFLGCLALVVMPFCVLMYNKLRWRGKIVLCQAHDPEVMVETFELDNAGFRSLTEDNSTQSHSPTKALG